MENEERDYVRIKRSIIDSLNNNGSRDFEAQADESQILFNEGVMSAEEYDDIISLIKNSL